MIEHCSKMVASKSKMAESCGVGRLGRVAPSGARMVQVMNSATLCVCGVHYSSPRVMLTESRMVKQNISHS
jgi:hypothetical protein